MHIFTSRNRFIFTLAFIIFLITLKAQTWTWMKGANLVNSPDVYGTLGVPASLNTPGARYGANSWTDLSGNLWLFGGRYGGNDYNDLWKYDPTTNNWTWVNGPNTAGQSGVYGTLGVGSSTNTPGSRSLSQTWTDNSGNLWLFGGEGRDAFSNYGDMNDLWKYNIGLNQWTWMKGSNSVNQVGLYGTQGVTTSTTTPGARRLAQSWKDASGVLWLFGGLGFSDVAGESKLNDMWKFDPSSNNWTWIHGSTNLDALATFGTLGVASAFNTPGSRYGGYQWNDNSGNLWLFGGYGFDASGLGYLSEIWKFNPSSGQWTWMDGSSTVNEAIVSVVKGIPNSSNTPGGRHVGASWSDAAGNLFILGGANGGSCGDLWKYDIVSGNWTWLKGGLSGYYAIYGTQGVASTNNDPGSGYHRAFWKDGSGNFWVFGGAGFDWQGNNSHLNDLWKVVQPAAAPTASFNFNQTSAVCSGARITIKDNSPNAPVAWSYSLDGVYWNTAQNPALQNPPTVTISPGTHTVSLVSANSVGFSSAYTQTISISSTTVEPVNLVPSGIYTIAVGSGATGNSDWSPWVYNFTDPLPAGVTINRVVMDFDAVDQGWGGSGAGLGCYFGGTWIGSPVLSHSLQHFSLNSYGPFANYQSGGTNNFSMYFVGYPGWQSFIYNANIVIYYEKNLHTVCAGNTVTLTASGTASSYTWTGGASNNVSHTPTATAIYTVTGTYSTSCINTNTVSVVVNALPTPTIVGTNSLCEGSSAIQTVTFANSAITLTWNTASNSSSISVSPTVTTVYSVAATNTLTGCSASSSKTITVSAVPILTVGSGSICSGNNFTISASGASTYTYSSGSNIVSPGSTTSYSVSGTSAVGCVAISPAISNVSVYTTPTVAVSSGSICNGSVFTITPSGASSYTISGGSATVNPSSNTTYSVTGSSTAGCVSANTAVVNLTVAAIPTLAITGNTSVCLGSSVSQTVSGANSYVWSSGPTSSVVSLSPSSNTTYSIIGTSVAGCTSNISKLITVNILPTITIGNFNICSGNTITLTPSGALTYTFSGGSNLVTPSVSTNYSISGTNSLGCISASAAVSSVTVNTTPTITVNNGVVCAGSLFTISPAGATTYTISGGATVVNPTISTNYSVTGTSAAGCVSTNTAISNLTVNPNPVLSIAGPNAVCNGFPISQTVTGASTYSWNTGSTSNIITISPSVTSVYTVSGTNTLTGCNSSLTKQITVGNLPVITVNSGNVCAGGVFTMVPGGASTYTFATTSGTVSSTVSPSVNTTYYVTGTSSLGCVSTASAVANVIVNPAPIISVNSGAMCQGGSFTLSPTGANTYTFLNGASVVAPTSNTTYSITGTNLLGCVSLLPGLATVSVNALPVISSTGGSVCLGSVYTLTASGASSYSYSSGSNTVSPSTNTNYSITGTSAQGCVSSNTAVITVTVNAIPTIAVSGGTVCSGNTYVLNPTGASSYSYSSGSATVLPTSTTSYSISGTSSLGCTSTLAAVANITVISLPIISVNNGTVCAGNVFTIIPNGAATYTYSSGSNTVSPQSNTVYAVTGTNSVGCISSNTAFASVLVNAKPNLSIAGNTVICQGSMAFISVGGASSYTWSNNSTGNVITVSPSSTTNYTVTGINSNSCTTTATVLLVVNPLPTITVNSGAICPGDVFVLTPSGASTYTYSGATNSVSPIVTSNYSVTGTSSNGCVSASPAIATVSVVNTLTLSVSGTSVICSGGTSTMLVTGANNYNWNTGATGNTLSVNPNTSASYTVIGSSGNCSDTTVFNVTVNPLPLVKANSNTKTICAGESATINATGANSYVWSGGELSPQIVVTPSSTSSFSVTGTDVNGCTNTSSITLTVNLCLGLAFNGINYESIYLYPNPTNGLFNVELPVSMYMQIVDITGRLVLQNKLEAGVNNISLASFCEGLYFVKFTDVNSTITFRVIKQ